MSWIAKPLNKRILLEKVQLDLSKTNLGGFNFILPETEKNSMYDFFRVLDIAADCDKMGDKLQPGDLVISENAVPIGKFGTKELFLSPELSITAILKDEQ